MLSLRLRHFAPVICVLSALATAAMAASTISGAGATYPFPIYSKWAAAYRAETGNTMNYQSIGSGGGIKQIQSKTVTFGATDMPLSPAELNRSGLIQFPTVIGGVVPVVNVRGVTPGQLVLDGPTLASIFLGKIANWNDPAIKKLNAQIDLPNQPILVVHRSDGSGTTFIFTNYLSKVSPEWKERAGAAVAVDWPAGIGAKGNEGVAANVSKSLGAVGYVEYAYAKQNRLNSTKMINRDGKVVAPEASAFAASADSATWDQASGFGTILTDQPGAATWPIAGATFVLVYKQPVDQAATREALKFFQWAYQKGDKMAAELDYVPFPEAVEQRFISSWSQVQGWSGGG